MTETSIEGFFHSFLALIALFIIALVLDYPEQRKKQRKKRCDAGNHSFTDWKFDYEIGYNDKDLYRRKCKHCKYSQLTISRLHPLANEKTTKH